MRLYGIRPWEMELFTAHEIEQIGHDLKMMNRENR